MPLARQLELSLDENNIADDELPLASYSAERR